MSGCSLQTGLLELLFSLEMYLLEPTKMKRIQKRDCLETCLL